MRLLFSILGLTLLFSSCNDVTVRKEGYPVHGIDVSHYQKEVNWKQVAQQGVHFTFIKATEGETFQDSFFCKNWSAAKAAGIRRGAYHFFRPSLSPEKQALHFIELADLSHGDLPPVLDIEVDDGMDTELLVHNIRTWLEIVEEHYKVRPIIYTYQKFFNRHLAGHLQEYPLWIARYSSWRNPCLKDDRNWSFWQYGNRGRLHGIKGPVDFNVFRGGLEELGLHCLVRPEPLFVPLPEDVAMFAP